MIKEKGVTLIEILLVMVIMGAMTVGLIRFLQTRAQQQQIEKTVQQMQLIQNAALAYYVNNAKWPTNLACLQGVGGVDCTQQYLPSTIVAPWGSTGGNYEIVSNASILYVYLPLQIGAVRTSPVAQIIAGILPLGFNSTAAVTSTPTPAACASSATTCNVIAGINIPGANLNQARAVNYSGIYKHGGCVPVPKCPIDKDGNTMTPQIMVVPVSVSGANDAGSTNVYPISSFTGYATTSTPADTSPPLCKTGGTTTGSCTTNNVGPAATGYWRVCMQIVTEKGDVQQTRSDNWGTLVSLMAVTRCAVTNESAGTNFNVYGN